ncbi:hypothetical protein pb186bvf_012970 [Paramecium bursaria]
MLSRQQSTNVPMTRTPTLQRAASHMVNVQTEDNIYELIKTHNVIKNINIVNTIKEKDTQSINKNHIVIYVIEIRTDYFDYQVYKRYKEFLTLYEALKYDILLPKFPEKKLFGSNKRKVIEERAQALQNFLQTVLENILIPNSNKYLEFIQIKEQFQKRGFQNIRLHGPSTDQFCLADLQDANDKKYSPQNDIERQLLHYINKLNQIQESRGTTYQRMEQYLFGKMQSVSYNMLQFLFQGDPDKQILGLIHMMTNDGEGQEHHISCTAGFQLLRKLLEFDYNPFAETALRAFCEIPLKQIKNMKISIHINSTKKCTQNALVILHKYICGNPSLTEQFIQYMLEDQETISIYNSYKQTFKQEQKLNTEGSYEDTYDIFHSTNLENKSSSKELNALLDVLPSPEQLQNINSRINNWKRVADYKKCSLEHLQAQIKRETYQLYCCMDRAYQLMVVDKSWIKTFSKFQIIENINENEFVAYDKYIWTTKSQFTTHIFISNYQIIRQTNKIIIKVSGLSQKDLPKQYQDLILKGEILNQTYMYIELNEFDGYIQAIQLMNFVDIDHKTHYFPYLLNEDNLFQATIDRLHQLI